MELRIGIDATGWRKTRGDGRFARNAIAALIRAHPSRRWILLVDPETVATGELPAGCERLVVPQRRSPAEALGTGSSRGPLDLARLTASDPLALPRLDAHYFRLPARLRALLEGRGCAYLRARRIGGRLRRLAVADHREPSERSR